MEKEEWLIIKDHTNYAVSNYGKVKRLTSGSGTQPDRILKSHLRSGYPTVCLWSNNKPFTCSVHKLVLEAFVGICPPNCECNHKDGVRDNNFYQNLEWITHSDNGKHAYVAGLNKGKLTQEQADEIRRLYVPRKITIKNLAETYKVDVTTIWKILKNKTW